MTTTVQEAVILLADAAETTGGTANDENQVVRRLVLEHGLGFNAWFCVCCELADRTARRQGFDNEVHRALTVARQRVSGGVQ